MSEIGQQIVLQAYRYFETKRGIKDRLFINNSESYGTAFAKARKRVTNKYVQCGVHSLRKEFANDFFDRETKKGKDGKAVKEQLTLLLGHSRIDVLKHYLK